MTTVAIDKLKAIIERVETLDEQKTEVSAQMKEILDVARSDGFDVSIIKKVMRLRKMKHEDLQTQDSLLQLYRDAVGV